MLKKAIEPTLHGARVDWQPHVHALVSRGGWTRNWEWVPFAHVDESGEELLYRHKVMRIKVPGTKVLTL